MPTMPVCLRLVMLLALVVTGMGVVQGVTDALHTVVHGGAEPARAAR